MNRVFSILAGLMLIALGVLTLLSNFTVVLFGFSVARYIGGLVWSPLVIGLGLIVVVTPLLTRGQPSAGGLFIPGMPILATGVVMLLATILPGWDVWARLWPLLVLALAAGFIALALYQRNVWIVIPAIYHRPERAGAAVLRNHRPVERLGRPLDRGTPGRGAHAPADGRQNALAGDVRGGAGFCVVSGGALAAMLALVAGLWRLAGVVSASGLILVGLALIVWSLIGPRRPAPTAAGSQA